MEKLSGVIENINALYVIDPKGKRMEISLGRRLS